MTKFYVACDKRDYYTGKKYTYQGESYPCVGLLEEAKRYKNKKQLQNLIDNGTIPWTGGWNFEIEEVEE